MSRNHLVIELVRSESQEVCIFTNAKEGKSIPQSIRLEKIFVVSKSVKCCDILGYGIYDEASEPMCISMVSIILMHHRHSYWKGYSVV